MTPRATGAARVQAGCELPPLILHPFDTASANTRFADLLLYDDESRAFMESRYAELRMLCFLGKDLDRWLTQCVECAMAEPALTGLDVTESMFITQLLFDPPPGVVRKMQTWGVDNFQVIFSRALGLNSIYVFPPEPRQISESFLREFHEYADALFDVRLKRQPAVDPGVPFYFEVYASSEYSKMLERSWAGVPED